MKPWVKRLLIACALITGLGVLATAATTVWVLWMVANLPH